MAGWRWVGLEVWRRGVSATAADFKEEQVGEFGQAGQVGQDLDSQDEDQQHQGHEQDDGQVWIALQLFESPVDQGDTGEDLAVWSDIDGDGGAIAQFENGLADDCTGQDGTGKRPE